MTIYTNPGSLGGTQGDDTYILTGAWSVGAFAYADAGDGYDRLVMQFDSASALNFQMHDTFNKGVLDVRAQAGYGGDIIIYNLENLQLQGSANNDYFDLQIGSNIINLSVNLDGREGQDTLRFDWSKQSTDLAFKVTGSTITSS